MLLVLCLAMQAFSKVATFLVVLTQTVSCLKLGSIKKPRIWIPMFESWFWSPWATFKNSFLLFSCTGSLLQRAGFLQLQQAEATLQLWWAGFSLQWLTLSLNTGSRERGLQQRWCMAQLLQGMQYLRLDIEPVSPALAGRFLTTGLPRKSPGHFKSLRDSGSPYRCLLHGVILSIP